MPKPPTGDGQSCRHGNQPAECFQCQAEELKDAHATCDLLAELLEHIALAVKGPPPPLHRYSWHDLPALVSGAMTVVAAARVYADHPRPPGMRAMVKTLDAFAKMLDASTSPDPPEPTEG
jgi:hypothetical protein